MRILEESYLRVFDFLFGRVGSLKDVKCRYKLIELKFQFFLKQI